MIFVTIIFAVIFAAMMAYGFLGLMKSYGKDQELLAIVLSTAGVCGFAITMAILI